MKTLANNDIIDDISCLSSDFVLLKAKVGEEKETLLSTALCLAVDYDIPVAIFTREMSKEQLIGSLITLDTNIPMEIFRSGKFNSDQISALTNLTNSVEKAHIYLDNISRISAQDIKNKVRVLVLNHFIKIILIDSLQPIEDNNTFQKRDMNNIYLALEELAKDLDITIIVLSQTNCNKGNNESASNE